MTNKCRFCGGKLISYEQKRFWYGCSDCRASGPLKSDKIEALAAMVGDGNENQLIETNHELNCLVLELKKNNEQLDKWNTEKVNRIDNLNDTIRILRTRNEIITLIPKKKNWPEGVVVVDKAREAKSHEAGRYRYWHKTKNDNSPHFTTISLGSMFYSDYIYKKLSAEELSLREKPVKQ